MGIRIVAEPARPGSRTATLLAAPAAWAAWCGDSDESPHVALPNRCELLVVGAGLTGLSAAQAASKAGCDTVLLESATIGAGATGRNSGFVIPIPARYAPSQLSAWLGVQAPLYMATLRRCARELLQYREATPVTNGWLQLSESLLSTPFIENARAWANFGVRVNALEAAQVQKLTGTRIYRSGLLFEEGGQINPLALANAMGARCRQSGATLIEHCRVLAVERRKGEGGYRVSTTKGDIQASKVIMAGNAYSHAGLRSTSREAIPVALVLAEFTLMPGSDILCANVPFSDVRKDMWFFRRSGSGHLMTGMFALRDRLEESGFYEHELRHRVQLTFGSAPLALTHLWAGRVGVTPRGAPRVMSDGHGCLSWTGCNGRGLALSYLLGEAMANQIVQMSTPSLPWPLAGPLYGRAMLKWLLHAVIANDRRRRTSQTRSP